MRLLLEFRYRCRDGIGARMTTTSLDFGGLHTVLDRWPALPLPDNAADGLYERVRQILVSACATSFDKVTPDLAPLLRHLLRRQSLRSGGTAQFRVPAAKPWPTVDVWAKYGINAHSETDTHVLIEARPWAPDWLNLADTPVFEDVFAEQVVRQDWRAAMDPFLGEASGFSSYASPGQREAVRSAFLVPPGETLVVCLPTGSGKSLVAQAPVLVRGFEGGLVLCIVPTTALALDQARQTVRMMASRSRSGERRLLAWHAGLSPEEKREIKLAIREGRQGILYCSPEAATGALLPALYAAAQAGLLDYLIVDEVHLLSQWGDGFRPAFQMIAGVRRGLLRECAGAGFRTILMSATLTTEAVETIDALFGPPATIQMVSSVHIRPEPQYWIERDDDPIAKDRKILEAVRHAPRPLILYVTKRADAAAWHKRLKDLDFQRVEMFHGETPDRHRERIIEDWSKNRIDIIVATSAFGVGIDKSDVRAVIHAAVPETVDRFYQEVGRGGRDGAPSGSMLIYSDADLQVAERIGLPSLISDELGFERWEAMAQSAIPLDPLAMRLKVDLTTVPPRLHQQTDYNTAWNMRTLIMMARAGILELDAEAPDLQPRDETEDDAAFDQRADEYWSDYYMNCVVEVHDGGHRDEATFTTRIQEERSRSYMAADANAALLKALVRGDSEIGTLLQRLYQSYAPGRAVVVSTSCGGCPVHRRLEEKQLSYIAPPAFGVERISIQDISAWENRFPHLSPAFPIVLLLPDPMDSTTVMSVLEEAVSLFNVKEIAVSAQLRSTSPGLALLHRRASGGFLMLQTLDEEPKAPPCYPVARISVLSEGAVPPHLAELARPLHILVGTASISDPWHPGRRLGDVGSNTLTLEQFRSGSRQ